MRLVRFGAWFCSLLVVAACSSGEGQSTATTTEPSATNPGAVEGPLWVTPLPGAVAANVASGRGEAPLIAWIGPGAVTMARVDIATGELSEVVQVNGSVEPIAHPIERPSLLLNGGGGLEVAFTAFQEGGASVFRSVDGSEPARISGEPVPETNLVHVTSGPEGAPVYAWLEMSTLSVGIDRGGAIDETGLVDDHTCDCCNPAPILLGSDLVVAYRDFNTIDDTIARDVVATRSTDGGNSYGDVIPIADDRWFIDGCPFSGPSAVEVDGTLVVAWMDARQSVHPDQQSSTIWVDRSEDGGASFGTDLAVVAEGVHSWPVMAVDEEGTIHLVWETQGTEGGLWYARSTDRGRSFSEASPLITRTEDDQGAPRSPSIALHDRMLLVSWADSAQGHLAGWDLG